MSYFRQFIFTKCLIYITHFILESAKGVYAKREDPDQMSRNVAPDLGLHFSILQVLQPFSNKNMLTHMLTLPNILKLKMDSSNIYGRRVHSVYNGINLKVFLQQQKLHSKREKWTSDHTSAIQASSVTLT